MQKTVNLKSTQTIVHKFTNLFQTFFNFTALSNSFFKTSFFHKNLTQPHATLHICTILCNVSQHFPTCLQHLCKQTKNLKPPYTTIHNATQLYKVYNTIQNYTQRDKTLRTTLQHFTQLHKQSTQTSNWKYKTSSPALQYNLTNFTQLFTTLQQLCTTSQHFTNLYNTLQQLYTTLHNFYKSVHNSTKLHTTSQNSTQVYTTLPNFILTWDNSTQLNKTLQDSTTLYTTLHNSTQVYKPIQRFTKFTQLLPSFAKLYKII